MKIRNVLVWTAPAYLKGDPHNGGWTGGCGGEGRVRAGMRHRFLLWVAATAAVVLQSHLAHAASRQPTDAPSPSVDNEETTAASPGAGSLPAPGLFLSGTIHSAEDATRRRISREAPRGTVLWPVAPEARIGHAWSCCDEYASEEKTGSNPRWRGDFLHGLCNP